MDKQIEELLPLTFEMSSDAIKEQIIQYLTELSPIDRRACKIAKEHLETSYDIVRSNGFQAWKKEKGLN